MESDPESRKYNSIWRALRNLPRNQASSEGVRITAPYPLHRRIIKAVKKEKWLDAEFKLEIDPMVAVLSVSRLNSVVTFRLNFYHSKMRGDWKFWNLTEKDV